MVDTDVLHALFWSDEIRHADPSAVEMTGWHCWTRLCRNVGTSKIDVKRSQDRPFLRYETPPNSKGQQRQKLLRGWPLHLRLGLLVAKKQGGTVGSAGCFPISLPKKMMSIVLRFHLQRSAQGSSNYSFVSRSYSLKCERSLRKMLLEHVKESLVTLFQVYPTRFTRNKGRIRFLQLSAALRWGAKGSEKRPTVTQEELQKHSSEEVGRERCSCSCSHSATAQGLGNVLAPLFTDMYTVYCSILYICK